MNERVCIKKSYSIRFYLTRLISKYCEMWWNNLNEFIIYGVLLVSEVRGSSFVCSWWFLLCSQAKEWATCDIYPGDHYR